MKTKEKMAAEQSMTLAITETMIEAAQTTSTAIEEAHNFIINTRPVHGETRPDGSAIKQATFDWNTAFKYQELYDFEIEIKHFLN